MAAAVFNLLMILTFLTSMSGKIPKLVKIFQDIYDLFATEIAAAVPVGGLEVAELSPQESALAEQITQALSADGTQAVFDLSKIRQFAKWLNGIANTPLGKVLIAFFGGISAGG